MPIKQTIAGTTCDGRNLLEHWKWWTGPSKSRPQPHRANLGLRWKINWTDLLYSQRLQKAWDNISVEVLRKYWHYSREMCCWNYCKRWTHQILKLEVDKNCTTLFIWYLLCSEQPSAFLEAKKVNIFRSVRCSNNFLATTVYRYTFLISNIFT